MVKIKYERTSLHWAAEEGRDNVAKILLEQNEQLLNAQDRVKRTPLHLAAYKGNKEMVTFLLGKGAKIDVQDENKAIPLHLAVEEGFDEIAEIFLRENPQLLHAQDGQGRTPLHLAAYNEQKRMINFLLEKGAEIDAQDENEATPLHLAAEKYMIRCKCYGETAVAENLDVVSVLITRGKANLAIKNKQEKTSFELLLANLSRYKLLDKSNTELEAIRDCLVVLLDYLTNLEVHRWTGGENQQLVDYLAEFEKSVQEYNSTAYNTRLLYNMKEVDLNPLKQIKEAFYDPIREHYGCSTASDRVVAYFLDRQPALLTRRSYWLMVLKLLGSTEECSSLLLKLPFEINLMIIKMIIQSRETFHSVSFSSEEKTDYKVLVQSFFDKEPLSVEEGKEESNPAISTETAAVMLKA